MSRVNRSSQNQPPGGIRISLGTVLIGGSVAFVGLVTALLAIFAYVSAENAAIEPLRRSTRLIVDAMAYRTRDYLMTAKYQGDFMAREVGRLIRNGSDDTRISRALVASLAAAPQISSILFIRPELTGINVTQQGEAVAVSLIDLARRQEARASFDYAIVRPEGSWGPPFIPGPGSSFAFLNYRVPVRPPGGDGPVGLVIVTLRSDQLSAFMRDLAQPPLLSAFILYGNERVLAHSTFDSSTAHVLPDIADVDDPALHALRLPPGQHAPIDEDMNGVQITARDVEGRSLLYLIRELPGFAPEVLKVGVDIDPADVGFSASRLRDIGLIGLSIVVLAALGAALLGKRLLRSISNLTDVATAVANLQASRIRHPSRSMIRELDDMSVAFGMMIDALRAFVVYVPRQLVRRLMANGGADSVVSEEREVTVVFTDLSGFSRLAEQLPPEQVATLLNEHFGELTACVEAEDGTVDKFLGDAVMAFWGAPGRQPDHAARALRAVRAMVEAFRHDSALTVHGLGLRIGVHTGRVIIGNIGGPERLNYTIVGDAVNVAARLIELGHAYGGPGAIVAIATETTIQAAGECGPVQDLGLHAVRGRDAEERVYRLDGAEAASQPARISATSLKSP